MTDKKQYYRCPKCPLVFDDPDEYHHHLYLEHPEVLRLIDQQAKKH